MVSGGPMVPLAWPARRDSDVVAEFDRRTTIKIFIRTVLEPLAGASVSIAGGLLASFDSIPLPARGAHEPCQSVAKALQTPRQSLAKALPKPCQSLAKALQKPCQSLAKALPKPCLKVWYGLTLILADV